VKTGYPGCASHRSYGFSLLELVIALAVAAVLLTAAVPSYRSYVQRADRADAIRRLITASDCQERLRSSLGHYDTTRCGDSGSQTYAISFVPSGAVDTLVFTVFAEPRHPVTDDRCGSLGLNQSGVRSISGPGQALADCWGGR